MIYNHRDYTIGFMDYYEATVYSVLRYSWRFFQMIYNHRDYTIDFIDCYGATVYSVPIDKIRPECILSGKSVWNIALDMYLEYERRKND